MIGSLDVLEAVSAQPGTSLFVLFPTAHRHEIFGPYGRLLMSGLISGGIHRPEMTWQGRQVLRQSSGGLIARSTLQDMPRVDT